MHVGGHPDDVLDRVVPDIKEQEAGDFEARGREGGPLSAFAQASKVPFGTSGLKSGTTRLIGMSLAISFHVAFESSSEALEPGELGGAEKNAEFSLSAGLAVGRVGAAE